MSYSFFFQAPNRDDNDTLIVDGRKLKFGTDERQREFAKLNGLADQYMWHAVPWSTESKSWAEKIESSIKGDRKYFAKGYFNELDDCGRHVGFLFCSDQFAGAALAQLIEVAHSEGFTLHPDVEAKFRENEKRRGCLLFSKKNFSMLAVLIAVVAALAWFVLC